MIRMIKTSEWKRCVAPAALLAVAASAGVAREKVTSELIYTPAVVIIPEVRAPDGELRAYHTPDGVTYWRAGLPVYQGDRVKLNVFVSTGGVDLAETRVRLDNEERDRRTSAPWHSSVDTGALAEGYHFVEAWARTGGKAPRDATATLVFFVDPKSPPRVSADSPVVEDVPPPKSAPEPDVDASQGGPTVRLSSANAEARKALDAGTRVLLTGPVEFSVTGPGPDEGYIYALYRGDKQIHRSGTLPLDTRVNLRPDAPGAPGLQPGTLRFVVWGADKNGRLGPPRITDIEIPG